MSCLRSPDDQLPQFTCPTRLTCLTRPYLPHQPELYPPPTKFTISTVSPSLTIVSSNDERLTMTRLCSTATRLASISNDFRRPVTLTGPGTSKGSPFSVMCTNL